MKILYIALVLSGLFLASHIRETKTLRIVNGNIVVETNYSIGK